MDSFMAEKHECELIAKEDVLSMFIQDGYCVNLRRYFRSWFLLSENDLRSKMYFKSAYVMREEKMRHVRFNYYLIHPYSCFMHVWEAIFSLCLSIWLLYTPIVLLMNELSMPFRICKLVLDLVCIGNIFIELNTGYLYEDDSTIVINRKKIFMRQLRSWFIIDVISCFNYNTIYLLIGDNEGMHYLRFCNYLRCLRLLTVFSRLENFRKRRQGSLFKYNLLKLAMLTIVMILWATCLMYEIFSHDAELISNDEFAKTHYILFCLRTAIRVFFSFGMASSKNPTVILVQIIGLYLGFTIQMILTAKIVQITYNHNYSRQKLFERGEDFYQFMKHKNLPAAVRNRITTYMNYRNQQNYFAENAILSHFPTELRQEVLLHNRMHLLENVAIFSELPTPVLYQLIGLLRSEVYLPSDVIIAGFSECMLFMASGTAAIYTAAGKEIGHLSDGANFGELCLITDVEEHKMSSIVAIDVCEVLILQKSDFVKKLEKYKGVHEKLRMMGQELLQRTYYDMDQTSERMAIALSEKKSRLVFI